MDWVWLEGQGPTSVSVLSMMIIYITHGGYMVYYFCFAGL